MTRYALAIVDSDPPLLCNRYGDTLSVDNVLSLEGYCRVEGPFVWTNKKLARQARSRFSAWERNKGKRVALVELEIRVLTHEVQ